MKIIQRYGEGSDALSAKKAKHVKEGGRESCTRREISFPRGKGKAAGKNAARPSKGWRVEDQAISVTRENV